jgi:carbon-monoxide dehydrogenase large subunit
MAKFGLSQSVRRVEDPRLLTGRGRYTDDISMPGQTHGIVLRSPHAHARITALDVTAAKAVPGVLAVITGADLKAAGLGDVPCVIPMKSRDGSPRTETPHPAIAVDTVRHVGDPVAFVVGETPQAARDGTEAILVEYDILPAVTDLAAAHEPGAPLVWPGAKNNIAFDWEAGDKAKTDAAFARAAHVTRLTVVNNRVIVASMEARAAVACTRTPRAPGRSATCSRR